MTVAELRAAWPFDGLLDEKPLPVQPTPEDGMLVAAARVETAPAALASPHSSAAVAELVPVPVSAPRKTDEKPKVLFVAMANLMGETTMAAPLSVPESLDLIARLYRQYGAGKPFSFVATAMAAEPASAATPALDPLTTGSIARSTLADLPEALRAEMPGRTTGSGAF
jgi:hypothetical protein